MQMIYVECQLGRSDVDRLFAVALEGITPAVVQVSTQRDATRYTAANLGDLIASLEVANVGSLNGPWPNLALEANEASGTRRVKVAIDVERAEFDLSGSDQTWVFGQAARLQLLLNSVGGSRAFTMENVPYREFLPGRILTVGWGIGAVFVGRVLYPPDPDLGMIIGFGCAVLSMFGLQALRTHYRRRANRPILLVNGEVERGSWWERLGVADRLTFVGAVVAAAGVLAGAAIGVAQITMAK
ncbi:hypothetical protein [Streptomyces phaeochromogenes]|uniref:hypothetical protein n=1 Tax=Streptomyces phaeochromogenes TaxID=1923 RepID=UPI002DDA9B90|nr:hypothetical protein [Streptomyces phaeochromogenes]WRZ32211.1 hypothetical protein OG931_33035 [Streptomyces phaeochromogenes]